MKAGKMYETKARRVQDDGEAMPEPNTFWKFHGVWHACPKVGVIANLGNHMVTEHEDGSLTVTPSILVSGGGETWHGFLTKGYFCQP